MPAYRDKQKKGTPWRYRKKIRLPDGTAASINGTPDRNTKLAAERAEREHIERRIKKFYDDQHGAKIEKEVPTIEGFMTEFMEFAGNDNKQSELASKRSIFSQHIIPSCGPLQLDQVGRREIESFKAVLRKKQGRQRKGETQTRLLSRKRINNVLTVLGAMLNYAEEIDLISEAPTMGLLHIPPQKYRFLDFNEYEALLKAAEEEPEWRLAVLLAGSAGLRLGEIRALRWDDWERGVKKMTVHQAFWKQVLGPTKGWNLRTVPLTSRLDLALRECRHLRGPYVVCNADGSHKKVSQMRGVLPRLYKRAGIEPCSWHPLRHTFCSHLAMKGAPVTVIQKLAGHADLKTTEKYMHLTEGATDQAIALLETPAFPSTSGNRFNPVATELVE